MSRVPWQGRRSTGRGARRGGLGRPDIDSADAGKRENGGGGGGGGGGQSFSRLKNFKIIYHIEYCGT